MTRAFELLRSGSPACREEALGLLQNTVFSFSMTLCGHREDAEDTMQDVLLKTVGHLGRFDTPKALTTWLYTVAKNRCWMSRRRSKFAPRQHLSLEDLLPDARELERLQAMAGGPASPEASAIAGQDRLRLQQAILQVPPSYRLVLVLHDVEELSTQEIARVLNIKEGNVRVRLHRARLFVRKELSQTAAIPAAPAGPAHGTQKSTAHTTAPRSRNCKNIFSNLSNYLDGALDEALCQELERHMRGCQPCEAFLSSLRNSIQQTRFLPPQLPDVHAAAQARAKLLLQAQSLSTGE